MAKAQKSSTGNSAGTSRVRKKSTSSTKKSNLEILKKEISGVFIIAFAIFLLVVTKMESQTGIIGKTINIFTHSAFGTASGLLPFFIIVIGIMRLLNMVIINDRNQIAAIIGFFVCYLIYAPMADSSVYSVLTDSKGIMTIISTSKNLGLNSQGGGILGNLLTVFFVKLVGRKGTFIVLGTLIFTFTILLTNQSVIGGIKLIISFIKKLFSSIYNFIFIEVDESENENRSKNKDENMDMAEQATDDGIKIFDYNSPNSDNKNRKREITRLKLDVQKDRNIHKDEAVKETNNINVNNDEAAVNQSDEKIPEAGKAKENKFEPKEITEDLINIAGSVQDKYELPPSSLLNSPPAHVRGDKADLKKEGEKLIETLGNFNIQCNILQINKGPTITRYELQPAPGIKVSRITSLANDLALSLATSEIRMEAPIPGKSAIGIEVPNKVKSSVFLRNLIESKEYKAAETNIPFALGKDIAGKNIVASIEKMPHLLIAGATGSGKSVCINSLIMSILFRAKPDEVKLILIDPKVVELSVYNGIPHLLIPVVTDPRKAANALNWAVSEMTNRYKVFAQNSVRDIFSYNEKMIRENLGEKMAQIVIVIDELADLMTVASSEVEEYITRIAQLARACGIHLVIATQRPSVDVITGVIKANIPSRIAFAVSSYIDSRTILDTSGAEKLLGKGDMLYHPMGMAKPVRIQGTFISDDEVHRVVESIRQQHLESRMHKSNEILEEIEKTPNAEEKVDEFLEQAIEMVVNDGQASTSYIQRKFKVGYSRAARIVDQLEERGIVGGHEGSKPRKVLITKEELEEMRKERINEENIC